MISDIVATIAAGASEAAMPAAPQAIREGYAVCKALLLKKYAAAATPIQAVEEKPGSDARQRALEEELCDLGADRDAELLGAVQSLTSVLNLHAPQSLARRPARVPPTTVQTGGGAAILGSVSTGGGTLVGRDHIINNITIHSVDQIQDLISVFRTSIGPLGVGVQPDVLDDLEVVLDEISKLYQLIDTEFTRYLSLSFDDQHLADDRAVLLSLEGGRITARASEARGHCEKITRIYHTRLRAWFADRLRADANAMARVDHAFGVLGSSDADMVYVIGQLAHWLSDKASRTLTLVDADDLVGARRLVREGRLDSHAMRQKLASTISAMRDIQAELLRLAP